MVYGPAYVKKKPVVLLQSSLYMKAVQSVSHFRILRILISCNTLLPYRRSKRTVAYDVAVFSFCLTRVRVIRGSVRMSH